MSLSQLRRRALAHVAMSEETVLSFYDGTRSGTAEQCLKALCESHERLRAELQGAEALLGTMWRESEAVKVSLEQQCVASGLPRPLSEEPVVEGRRWRFDLCWPDYSVAVEQQGGTHTGGRHVRGTGYANDCAKLNEAQLDGWLCLWVTTAQVESGEAVAWVRRALESRGWRP